MATPNYTEEEILFRRRARRRLVGAVVLVVAVVAIVPMILPESKPQQETQQIEIRIPAQDGSGYTSKITPVPETPPASQAQSPAPAAEPPKPAVAAPPEPAKAPVPEVKTEKPVATDEARQEAKPAETAKPSAPAKPAAAAKQTYFVQYGAFSEGKNAKQRQAELKAKGINTFTEVVKTAAGDKIRVRSGPYASRDDAEKVRSKVKPLDSKLVVTGGNT